MSVARCGSTISLDCMTPQTLQFGFGGFKESLLITRAPERSRKTILALLRSSRITLKAWRTQRLAVIALVVAIAGMMLPAICLMSNFDLSSIPNVIDRRLAVAATKSRVSSSSLSKVRTEGGAPDGSFDWACCSRRLNRCKLHDVSLIKWKTKTRNVPITEDSKILSFRPYSLILLAY